MRNIYFILFAFCFGFSLNAQIVNIPDVNFKAKLLSASPGNNIAKDLNGMSIKIDIDNDGEIQLSEAILVVDLDVFNSNILTLVGIESFVNLRFLDCTLNQISYLDLTELSDLRFLDCAYNQLYDINVNGLVNLDTLFCNSNQLISLNLNSLTSLITLFIDDNPELISLYIKNGSNEYVLFSNNPNLQYICADETQINQLQNVLYYDLPLNSINLNSYCSFTPGGAFYIIQGNSKFDGNNNGCDDLDNGYPNLKISINNGTVYGSLIANNLGTYSIPVQAGTHNITPQFENPSYFTISPTSASVTFPSTTSPFIQNFCIAPNGIHHDLEIVVIPIARARPGFDAIYKIKYRNKGNQNENATINFNYDDAILDFVSSNILPTTQATNNLLWNVGSLTPFQSGEILVTLNVNSPMETPAINGGDVLSYNATANGLSTDETPNDNIFTLSQTVVNSFDPNDKTCLEGATITPSQVGKDVHYMIRFENTGTANAQNIVVKDMIDTAKFDISTLQITDASHSCVTKITNPNKVEFIFENIQLPFDDIANDGYVVFKIKTKPTLVLGNTFSNSASIYFDYNFPIITNTATTTVSNVLANQDFDFVDYFSINPNPAKDILTIQIKENIEVSSINIYNTLGQLVLLIPNAKDSSTIDVSSLKTGNYFIKVLSDKGVSSTKFIKE